MERDFAIINSEDNNQIPIEELFGSVTTTTYNCSEGSDSKSHQVRTSARVFKKLKLDSAVAAASLPLDRKESNLKEEKPEINKKPLRPTWTPEDKSLFFEALNYYGKDFESIHTYISGKLKKKGIPESAFKTKDQIRHFYYRNWHKISKHLKFSEGVKKLAQELYGLINYGELRRKVGSVSEKIRMKLNELMYRGNVAIRCRGKTIRVKTPLCRALRRLNQLDEKQEEPKLPTRILVEVVPRDINSWTQVQSMAQNPRVSALLPLQKRLSSLLEYLTSRWKPTSISAYEKLIDSLKASNDTNEENRYIIHPPLRLYPTPTCEPQMPVINLGEYLTSLSVCLSAYEERLGIRPSENQPWSFKGSLKNKNSKRCKIDNTNDKLLNKSASRNLETNDINANDAILIKDVKVVIDEAINTMLSLQNQNILSNQNEKTDEVKQFSKIETDSKNDENQDEERKKTLNNYQLGWTLDDCGTLTIGELYLMFGSESKLLLEYTLDNRNFENVTHEKEEYQKNIKKSVDLESTSSILHKLLSVAKLHTGKSNSKCSCGHICSNTNDKISSLKNKTLSARNFKNNHVEQKINIDLQVNESNGKNEKSTFSDQIESVFKHPRSYGIESIMNSHIDHLRPKYCNRKGRRLRTNKLVVERRLALLANKNNADCHQIVQMNIIPQEKKTLTTKQNQLETENNEKASNVNPAEINDNATTSSRVSSPTNISTLLDFPLLSCREIENNCALKSSSVTSFDGLLPPSSPSCILKENENQWITAEVADFSLSSFLGHLESPVKATDRISPPNSLPVVDDSRFPQDVDAHLQSLFLENSVDYMAQFADLAAQVTSEKK